MGMPVENSSGGKKRTEENRTASVCVCVCVWSGEEGSSQQRRERRGREQRASLDRLLLSIMSLKVTNRPAPSFVRARLAREASIHACLCRCVHGWEC